MALRKPIFSTLFIGAALLMNTWAVADPLETEYPTRSVKIIVPFAAGGGLDFAARLVAEGLTNELGQAFVVVNRPGVAGQLGTAEAAKAPADGYTLVMGGAGTFGLAPALYKDKLNYDAINDFDPVSLVVSQSNVLLVPLDSPAQDLPGFIEYVRESPRELDYASVGIGTTGHMTMELFKLVFDLPMMHVPYTGNQPGLSDLIAGRLDATIENLSASMAGVKAGQLRALAVTTASRSSSLPDVPTVTELTGEEFDVGSWIGVLAPANTPRPIIETLQTAIEKTMSQPEAVERFKTQGAEVVLGSSDEFRERIEFDIAKWEKVVTEANISID